MLENQIDQHERREVQRNDQLVKEQTGTFMSHTHSELGGRFSVAQASPYVIGTTAVPIYPQAAFQHDPCGPEPGLGFRIDAMEPLEPCSAQGNSGDADVPSPLAASPLSMAAQGMSQMSSSSGQGDDVRIERPPTFRRRV
jgi:hypothetical protein